MAMPHPFAFPDKESLPELARSERQAIDGGFVSDLALTACLIVALAMASNSPDEVLFQSILVFAIFSAGMIVLRRSLPAHRGSSPADRICLVRAGLAAWFAGLVFHGAAASALSWWLPIAACVAVFLDGVDGWLARRTGMVSAFGGRLDIEADALLVLALSGVAWQLGSVGIWVVGIGLMRYAFAVASWISPALRRPLPPSRRRQWVGVIQVAALVVCIVPTISGWFAGGVAFIALMILLWSFAIDIAALLRRGSVRTSADGVLVTR